MANVTFESVAKDMHLSRQNVIDVFDKYVEYSPGKLPKIMSWDEKHLNKAMTDNAYMFVIVDFKEKKIFDAISSRYKDRLIHYFTRKSMQERDNVEYITNEYIRLDIVGYL